MFSAFAQHDLLINGEETLNSSSINHQHILKTNLSLSLYIYILKAIYQQHILIINQSPTYANMQGVNEKLQITFGIK